MSDIVLSSASFDNLRGRWRTFDTMELRICADRVLLGKHKPDTVRFWLRASVWRRSVRLSKFGRFAKIMYASLCSRDWKCTGNSKTCHVSVSASWVFEAVKVACAGFVGDDTCLVCPPSISSGVAVVCCGVCLVMVSRDA